MINIQSGTKLLKLAPYERIPEPECADYDRIMVWVEFSIPQLKTQFSAEFMAGDLETIKEELIGLYQSLKNQKKSDKIVFSSVFEQVMLTFYPDESTGSVALEMVLKPENNVESITLTDLIGIDESYFPALLNDLDELINWQN
ncbi:hypothetical protein [Rouxiella sp. WC2420]|uniref:DUF1795 domain-containing protein n=2 Tax=Yersiniaceae TaxID=1903411 RepID=A0AB39VN22_9GAMM